jgi:phospholipid transport system substrate-binding protein
MAHGKSSRILFNVIGFILLASFIFLPVAGGAEQKGAEESVKRMNLALLESMKRGDEMGFRGRHKLLAPVIRDVFALPFMGEVSLGSFWKKLSPEQRKLFLDTYTDWTISSYAGNFDSYSGEKFEIRDGQESRGDQIAVVSNLIRPHEDSIDFYYTLRRFKDKWRIVDIRIEGVSQLALTRGQFVSVMKKKGFGGLISSLQEKISLLQNKHITER